MLVKGSTDISLHFPGSGRQGFDLGLIVVVLLRVRVSHGACLRRSTSLVLLRWPFLSLWGRYPA